MSYFRRFLVKGPHHSEKISAKKRYTSIVNISAYCCDFHPGNVPYRARTSTQNAKPLQTQTKNPKPEHRYSRTRNPENRSLNIDTLNPNSQKAEIRTRISLPRSPKSEDETNSKCGRTVVVSIPAKVEHQKRAETRTRMPTQNEPPPLPKKERKSTLDNRNPKPESQVPENPDC